MRFTGTDSHSFSPKKDRRILSILNNKIYFRARARNFPIDMKTSIHRRQFITTGVLTLTGYAAMSAGLKNFAGEAPLRVGLIGCGSRGGGIASIMKGLPQLELTACCDINEKNLQNGMKAAVKHAKAYRDYRQLLDDKRIEAVIIATPLYLHHRMATDAINAGKHVYLEKTMTYDIPQALDLVKEVDASGLVLQVGHQYRYYALYHKVAEVIAKGWLGNVTQFECQYNRNSDWRRPVTDPSQERQVNWRMYREYSGGLVAELCAHQIDIVNWIVNGHPEKVTGFGGIDYWKDGRETYDNVRLLYEYPGGVKASVTSMLMNEYKGYSMRILGSKATIEIQREKAFLYSEAGAKKLGTVDGVTGATVEAWTHGEGVPLAFKDEGKDPTAYALLGFASSVRQQQKPASNVHTGRDVAIAVHMGNAAMETGQVQLWKPEYSA
jgi:predicted dehydrogenase